MKPKPSPDSRPARISAFVPKTTAPPKIPSGVRPAVRAPLPPRPLPARRPEETTREMAETRPDLGADDTVETTLVELVSAHLVAASRADDSATPEDPPTRETPVDVEAMLRAVSAQGLPSPLASQADALRAPAATQPAIRPAAIPPAPTPSPLMPSMFARPDPTPRMSDAPVAPPPPAAPSRLVTPPPFPAMRPQSLSSPPSPAASFAPLPELPLSIIASPSSSWRPGLPGAGGATDSSSSLSTSLSIPTPPPSYVTGVSMTRRPALPHPVARRAYLDGMESAPAPSPWKRGALLVLVSIAIAATMVGLAHVVTGGVIWSAP